MWQFLALGTISDNVQVTKKSIVAEKQAFVYVLCQSEHSILQIKKNTNITMTFYVEIVVWQLDSLFRCATILQFQHSNNMRLNFETHLQLHLKQHCY